MPLTTRTVSPIDLSLNCINASIQRDELQCVANGTLTNLIRQLCSLSRHAEQLFTDVHREILKIDHKSNTLFLRVERLTQKVLQSDINRVELTSLEDNNLRKAFKSTNIIDQHSLDRQTLPNTLQELYQKCDLPPDLNQLNPYRDDPKNALSYYTDPSYFFDLWKEEMLKDLGRGCRNTRSPGIGVGINKSPSRNRRKQRINNNNCHQQDLIYQTNSFHYNYGLVGSSQGATSESRYICARPTSSDQNTIQQLNFPAEYQAPQHSMLQSDSNQIQPPPGMSLQAAEAKQNISVLQQKHNYSQQQFNSVYLNERHLYAVLPQKQNLNLKQSTNFASDSVNEKFHNMSLNSKMGENSTAVTVKPNFGGFLEDDEDDELPPPPPVLSSHSVINTTSSGNSLHNSSSNYNSALNLQIEYIDENLNVDSLNRSLQISDTMQFVPSGNEFFNNLNSSNIIQLNNSALGQKSQGTVFPPPPPPPATLPLLSKSDGFERQNSAGGSFSTVNNKLNDIEDIKDLLESKSESNNKQINLSGSNQISSLLIEIQSGIKLKKVQRQEELAEVRAAHASNDVAAILKRRMEHMMGNDESSDSNNSDSNSDWDD